MFCMKCGMEIPNETTNCPSCGAPTAAAQTPPPAPTQAAPAQAAKAAASSAIATFASLSKRTVAKIAVLLAMICFFLPFVTVSCDGGSRKEIEETYSGFELISTVGAKDDQLVHESGNNAKANIWLIGSFATATAALVVLCLKKKAKIAAICNIASVVLLAQFRLSFKSYYGIKDSEYAKYILVDFRWGLTICVLFLLISLLYCFLAHNEEQSGG